ncbi:MAG: response regulator [Candidatus Omnitrophica bacterium]|nr:response regulator [Candidatus Omnitrophota bacterium]
MKSKPVILLVDDELSIRKVIGKRLAQFGFSVLAAASGEEGLQLAAAHHPDLILLDIMMPNMKGRDVCARLKADPATNAIPVIFLTALGLADHIKGGMDLGADDYIIKPFDPDKLRERIMVCLARHQR